jgi:hypothetical protein
MGARVGDAQQATNPAPDAAEIVAVLGEAIAAWVREHRDDPAAVATAERFERFVSNARVGLRLDEAMEIAPGPGGRMWWRAADSQARDDAVRELVDLLLPTGSDRAKAEACDSALRRYVASAWRSDSVLATPPAGYSRARALEFLICRLTDGKPPGESRIRQIIAGQ